MSNTIKIVIDRKQAKELKVILADYLENGTSDQIMFSFESSNVEVVPKAYEDILAEIDPEMPTMRDILRLKIGLAEGVRSREKKA